MLRSLPESLDETYERMLRAINPYLIEDARRILTLLCFASRPLAVQELIDGVAVEINNSTGLNRKRRLQDANGIRDICGAFIDIGLGVDHTIKHSTKLEKAKNLTPTVRIAHFSIQEYLESERIRQQKAAIFSLTSATAHAEIAQLCLVYLLEPGLSRSELDQSVCKEYPLAHFAAMYWYYHYQKTAKNAPGLDDCILRMFQHQRSFTTWVMLHDIDNHYEPAIDFNRTLDDIASPIYYASLLGLGQALLELTHTVESESIVVPTQASTSVSEVSKRVNALGGFCGNALQAASGSGHKKIVQMLLDRGADVNSQGGHYDNALLVASTRGHEKIVQILLDRGADVNAQSGNHHNNALQAASYNGHEKIVQILLDRGADVNAQSGYHHNALPAALRNEYEKVLQILLERGADVNARGEYQSTALQMLLKGGADVNVRVKYFRTALQISSFYGHDTIVQMLLDRGADVNAQDEFCITALQEASEKGHDKIVQMLLKAGADVTLQDQHGQSATENSEERQSELM